ncbi:dGTPase [Pelistega sp. NLN82]|uniref:dGTPase n=2 Tax=Pelistega ratti TaxID=2652177 RepID=A0A6L9Y8Z6_9BURK|nr:dGTPase [Pelistega ratti]
MSAGKSTLINALIGTELLHSANEATTATITRIHDVDHIKQFIANTYDYQGNIVHQKELATAESLKQWNQDKNIKSIDLMGNIRGLTNTQSDLVIYDTPGPNNSQDDNHEELTMELVNDGNYGMILYILNATQLGINDDLHLLHRIKQAINTDHKKEIIFVLNKIDEIDETYESIEGIVNNAIHYLQQQGFENPTIIPCSAKAGLIARKLIYQDKLTRSERHALHYYFSYFLSNKDNFTYSTLKAEKIAHIDTLIRQQRSNITISVDDKHYRIADLATVAFHSGVGILAYLIQDKLNQPKALYNNILRILTHVTQKNLVLFQA